MFGGELVEPHRVVDRGVGSSTVRADGGCMRVEGIGDAADVLEHTRASDRGVDARGELRIVEASGLGVEDDPARRAREAGEPVLDEVHRSL